uniref:Fibronectin type-III domain-containing protein n=1 Tax=Macrostomum lignano TaxID=282301 RepID=A0A1I8FFG8_9PLAT
MWLPPLLLLALLPAAAVALQKINNPQQQEALDVQNRKFHPDRRLSFVTKETGYIISGLQPDTAYTVQVSAQGSSDQLRSRPAVMTFRTERAAPSPDPVRSFRVLAANSTDLQISWDPACGSVRLLSGALRDLTLQSDRQFNATCSPPAEGLRLRVHPHRRYRLLATVLSDFGQSRPAMLSLRTPSARPNRSPSNFTAVGASSGAQLTWLPPPLPGRNGLLVGYRIATGAAGRVRRLGDRALGEDADIGDDDDESIVDGAVYKVTVPGDQLTHRLAGLKPLRRYAAQVAAQDCQWNRQVHPLAGVQHPARTARPEYRVAASRRRAAAGEDPNPAQGCDRHRQADSILLSWTRPSALVIPDKYVIYYGSQLPKERLAGEISGDQDAYQIRNLGENSQILSFLASHKE